MDEILSTTVSEAVQISGEAINREREHRSATGRMRRARRVSCQIGTGFMILPFLMRFGNNQSSSCAFIRSFSASRRSMSASVSRIGRLARWYFGMWSLPLLMARTTQVPGLCNHVQPFECQLLWANRGHRHQVDQCADGLLQSVDQLDDDVIAGREFFLLLDPLRREINSTCRIGRHVPAR
jgi:hypothetical protein